MKQEQQEWEERFDEKFPEINGANTIGTGQMRDYIKFFIAQEIQKAREEERERVVKIAEGMKKDIFEETKKGIIAAQAVAGYNKALTDLTNNLTEK